MADIVDLVSRIKADVPGAPEPTIVRAYLDAARRFFFRTRAWRGNTAITKESAGIYTLDDTPTGAEAFDGTFGDFGDNPKMEKLTLTQMYSRWSKPGQNRSYRITSDGKLHVYPDKGDDISGTSRLIAVYRPTRDATVLDDDQADLHDDRIYYGTLGILLAKPNRPWTELNTAAYYSQVFRDEIDEWVSMGANGGMRGVRRTVKYGGY